MSNRLSRRGFFAAASGLGALGLSVLPPAAFAQPAAPGSPSLNSDPCPAGDSYPAHDPQLARDVVGASHGDLKRVRDLVEKLPALALASVDWGFGDWEAAIDAAAHVGRRDNAEFLLSHGARPTIFSAAMMGQLDVVKAFVAARPGVQKIYGPHGITLMAHARAGGADAAPVVQYLAAAGDADTPLPSQPLAAADRDATVGKYVYGAGPRDSFDVDVQNDRLGINRPGGPSRRALIHLGELVFFPIGVPTVKIAFARAAGAVTQFTIGDPGVMLTAKRQ
jgi:hypothetical protein